jgi:hypothetical protein
MTSKEINTLARKIVRMPISEEPEIECLLNSDRLLDLWKQHQFGDRLK